MITTGQFVKDSLIEAGSRGCTVADLHAERKANSAELNLRPVKGTYFSFYRYFYWLIQLGFVRKTGRIEPSFAKGGDQPLNKERVFYSITPKGLAADTKEWQYPRLVYHPDYERKKYYTPTGRRRGRPRIADQ